VILVWVLDKRHKNVDERRGVDVKVNCVARNCFFFPLLVDGEYLSNENIIDFSICFNQAAEADLELIKILSTLSDR
jgi:hypothetical protein